MSVYLSVPFYQHPQEDASQLGDLEKFLRALG